MNIDIASNANIMAFKFVTRVHIPKKFRPEFRIPRIFSQEYLFRWLVEVPNFFIFEWYVTRPHMVMTRQKTRLFLDLIQGRILRLSCLWSI